MGIYPDDTIGLRCNLYKGTGYADDEFITVSGVVKDKQTRKKLEYVNISIPGTNVGTITNNDGEFSIKVKNGLHARQVEVSHIGYLNGLIPVNDKDILECTVLLEPNMNSLAKSLSGPEILDIS